MKIAYSVDGDRFQIAAKSRFLNQTLQRSDLVDAGTIIAGLIGLLMFWCALMMIDSVEDVTVTCHREHPRAVADCQIRSSSFLGSSAVTAKGATYLWVDGPARRIFQPCVELDAQNRTSRVRVSRSCLFRDQRVGMNLFLDTRSQVGAPLTFTMSDSSGWGGWWVGIGLLAMASPFFWVAIFQPNDLLWEFDRKTQQLTITGGNFFCFGSRTLPLSGPYWLAVQTKKGNGGDTTWYLALKGEHEKKGRRWRTRDELRATELLRAFDQFRSGSN